MLGTLRMSVLMPLPSGLVVMGLMTAIPSSYRLLLPPATVPWHGGGSCLPRCRIPPAGLATSVDKARHDDESLPTAAESRSWFGLEGADSVGICGPGLTVCFRAMTVNVQTLAQDPSSEAASDNDGFTGRAAFLREQCRYHGVNILALQETRTKKFDTFNSHSHIRLCSGCDSHGHHGVELWFDKHLALSTCVADPIRVQLSDLLVLFADPRTLLVRFTRRGLHILFVVVHAPTAASPERAHWWKVLSERVSRFSRGCGVVLLGDFNTPNRSNKSEKLVCKNNTIS